MIRQIQYSLFFLLIAILSFCFCCCETRSVSNPIVETNTQMEDTVQNSDFAIQYTVCRTGGGRIEGWTSQHGPVGTPASREVTAVAKEGYLFSGWSDGVMEETRQDVFADHDRVITANFTAARAELPMIFITTETGRDVASKTEFVDAEVAICNTGCTAWELSGAKAQIRGRGNATWTFEKKSYRLKFEHKQQLLGLGTGPSRTWILMANQCDQSLLRNYAALYMANRLDGIGFNSSGTCVEVYLNGSYRGVYLLAEQVQVGDNRIVLGNETEDDITAPDAGFMVELDMYAEGDYKFYIAGRPYEVKSDVFSDDQFQYIIDYIQSVEDAIASGEKEEIQAVLDLDSTVDGYILEEFFKNIDVGWSSFYMYKKTGDVLHLGPFWDFDLAAGNDYRLDNGSYEGFYVGENRHFDQGNRWYIRLCREQWFLDMVKARYEEVLPIINDTIDACRRMAAAAPVAFARNFDTWQIFGQRINQEPEHIMALSSHADHAEALAVWLEHRRDWMTSYFSES